MGQVLQLSLYACFIFLYFEYWLMKLGMLSLIVVFTFFVNIDILVQSPEEAFNLVQLQ